MKRQPLAAVLEYIERSDHDPVVHEVVAHREVDQYLHTHPVAASAVADLVVAEKGYEI